MPANIDFILKPIAVTCYIAHCFYRIVLYSRVRELDGSIVICAKQSNVDFKAAILVPLTRRRLGNRDRLNPSVVRRPMVFGSFVPIR